MAFLSQPSTRHDRLPGRAGPFTAGAIVRCLVIALCMLSFCHSQSEGHTEYQVKAAFVYNFAKFVEWPADAFNSSSAPLRFCVLGESLVGPDLKQITQGKSISGHPIQVLLNSGNPRECHVLFISSSHSVPVREVRESLHGAPVLMIGESKDFAAQGGTIGFLVEDARVRFEVNLQVARQNRLSISSKLLSLARKVLT
jgi:uncharacterized protein DUF4154